MEILIATSRFSRVSRLSGVDYFFLKGAAFLTSVNLTAAALELRLLTPW
jgi:hypothetical protein